MATAPAPCDGGNVVSVLDGFVAIFPCCVGDYTYSTREHIEIVMCGLVLYGTYANHVNTCHMDPKRDNVLGNGGDDGRSQNVSRTELDTASTVMTCKMHCCGCSEYTSEQSRALIAQSVRWK